MTPATRDDLHQLVDALPGELLDAARAALRGLVPAPQRLRDSASVADEAEAAGTNGSAPREGAEHAAKAESSPTHALQERVPIRLVRRGHALVAEAEVPVAPLTAEMVEEIRQEILLEREREFL